MLRTHGLVTLTKLVCRSKMKPAARSRSGSAAPDGVAKQKTTNSAVALARRPRRCPGEGALQRRAPGPPRGAASRPACSSGGASGGGQQARRPARRSARHGRGQQAQRVEAGTSPGGAGSSAARRAGPGRVRPGAAARRPWDGGGASTGMKRE